MPWIPVGWRCTTRRTTRTKTWHSVHPSAKANLARWVCRGCPSFLVGAWEQRPEWRGPREKPRAPARGLNRWIPMRLVKPPASPTNQLTPLQIRWQVLASPSAWPWLNRARRGCFDISRLIIRYLQRGSIYPRCATGAADGWRYKMMNLATEASATPPMAALRLVVSHHSA